MLSSLYRLKGEKMDAAIFTFGDFENYGIEILGGVSLNGKDTVVLKPFSLEGKWLLDKALEMETEVNESYRIHPSKLDRVAILCCFSYSSDIARVVKTKQGFLGVTKNEWEEYMFNLMGSNSTIFSHDDI